MGDSSPEAATSYHDPLDAGNLEAIVSGRHGAPFDVLGSHVVTVGKRRLWIVRVFRPYADAVAMIPEAPVDTVGAQPTRWPESLAMSPVHNAGLYTLVAPLDGEEQPPAYHLNIHFVSGVSLET
jgi:hypothetical protein